MLSVQKINVLVNKNLNSINIIIKCCNYIYSCLSIIKLSLVQINANFCMDKYIVYNNTTKNDTGSKTYNKNNCKQLNFIYHLCSSSQSK